MHALHVHWERDHLGDVGLDAADRRRGQEQQRVRDVVAGVRDHAALEARALAGGPEQWDPAHDAVVHGPAAHADLDRLYRRLACAAVKLDPRRQRHRVVGALHRTGRSQQLRQQCPPMTGAPDGERVTNGRQHGGAAHALAAFPAARSHSHLHQLGPYAPMRSDAAVRATSG